MGGFKVLTYNTWHGLNGKGTLEFGTLEPRGRRDFRHRWQIQELRKVDADLIFLQEVCPLKSDSEHFSRALQMDQVHQLDQSGIKLGGRGFPRNLSTGLALLAKRRFELQKLKGLKLSGGLGRIHDWLSFQVSEFRYALMAEVKLPRGKSLLINTHLHHAPILEFHHRDHLRSLHEKGLVSTKQKDGFLKAIESGHERRLHEGRVLLEAIRELRGDYQLVILCGDLNDVASSELLKDIREEGFEDSLDPSLWNDPGFWSWNHSLNEANHSWTQHLNPPIPTFSNAYLVELFRDMDRTPRRIDYILFEGNARVKETKLVFQTPVPLLEKGESLIGSDHFGVLSTFELTI
jgi:endonuclease/exonuclease/phosphatase family metal-dependent hydrolase